MDWPLYRARVRYVFGRTLVLHVALIIIVLFGNDPLFAYFKLGLHAVGFVVELLSDSFGLLLLLFFVAAPALYALAWAAPIAALWHYRERVSPQDV